ncbi:carbon-nitrogen hydrolase family protein [Thiomonas sp.]|uniref:carbon-nitrogen hydrolase family protein n=1 Tax=Thiomonas sp. TaxID=2047785 RepID=UPI002604FA72|nr:carbon-nitrogen hydrolase family protein [Thiomonas sp.]
MQVAVIQMVSTSRVDANLQRAQALLEHAAAQGALLAVLPEYFCLMGSDEHAKVAAREVPGDGPIQQFLAATARRLGMWIAAGSLPLACSDPVRVFNSTLVFDPQGRSVARYDKMHLFAFDRGAEHYAEADSIVAGSQPVAFSLPDAQATDGIGWRVGLSICYDLRFPELYRALCAPQPCDALLVPAAFTHTTGKAHWEVLLRARAIENQCYVLASAQGGRHDNGRRTFGHSMIVDPWGEVLDVLPEGEGVVCAELSAARIAEVRSQLPALRHRKLG